MALYETHPTNVTRIMLVTNDGCRRDYHSAHDTVVQAESARHHPSSRRHTKGLVEGSLTYINMHHTRRRHLYKSISSEINTDKLCHGGTISIYILNHLGADAVKKKIKGHNTKITMVSIMARPGHRKVNETNL